MSNPESTAIQYTFIGGEVHPSLYNRQDWAKRSVSAARIENAVVLPTSGAVKRGGFRYVCPALSDIYPSTLVEFEFSDDQAYILEFGEYELRVLTRGAVVLDVLGYEYRISSPYSAQQAGEFKYRQDHDVLFFAHVDVPPMKLTRYGHDDWRWEWVFAGDRIQAPENVHITLSGADGAWYVVTTLSDEFGESGPSKAVRAINPDFLSIPMDGTFSALYRWMRDNAPDSIPDDLHFHEIDIEDLVAFLIGCGYEDRGIKITNGGRHWSFIRPNSSTVEVVSWWGTNYAAVIAECLYACDMGWKTGALDKLRDAAQKLIDDYDPGESATGITALAWDAVDGAARYRVYRSKSAASADRDFYRRIAEVGTTYYTDNNDPDGTASLPADQQIFDEPDDYPGVVALFQQRLAYAYTKKNPAVFFASAIGNYADFEEGTEDDSAFKFRLSATKRNAVMDVVALKELIVLTTANEFVNDVSGALTVHNVNFVPQSRTGTSRIPALVVDNIILRVPRGQNTIQSFYYSLTTYSYVSKNLLHAAGHLLQGKKIVDFAHQEHPHNIIWVLLDDGALAACTFVPDEEILAWSRHNTNGEIINIATIFNDEKNEQELWAVVRRTRPSGTVRQCLEILESPLPYTEDGGNLEEAFYVDSGLSGTFIDPVTAVDGLDHLEGMEVAIFADGNVLPRQTVINGRVQLGRPSRKVHVGLPYDCVIQTLDIELEQGTLRNAPRAPWRIVAELYNTRELHYSVNGGKEREALLQRANSMGLVPPIVHGDKELVAKVPHSRGTNVRLSSPNPVPFGILSLLMEVEVAHP